MTRGGVVCLVGPDGVGKTTQAQLLAKTLRRRGLRVKHVWLRFSHIFSLPVLALAKMLSLSEQVTYDDGSRVGYHSFQKSASVSIAYEAARVVDFWFAYLFKVKLWARLGWVVICDRFYPDVVADLRLSTGGPNRLAVSVWHKLRETMPEPSEVFLLQVPFETLRGRRPDLGRDRTLKSKVIIYAELKESLGLRALDADRPPGDLQETLEKETRAIPGPKREKRESTGSSRTSIRTRLNQLHSEFVKGPHSPSYSRAAVILSSSWLFQGMLYAGRTEIAFRLSTELGLLLLLAAGLALWIPLPLALAVGWAIAHSANWVFNGQPFVALRSTGQVRTDPQRFDRYLASFEVRARRTACLRFAAVYGSGWREGFSDHSDLDIKIVRKEGLWNGLKAMMFLMAERTRSTLSGFPLDIYVLDSTGHLRELEGDSEGVVILPATREAFPSHP
jgi:thymidylate kinase